MTYVFQQLSKKFESELFCLFTLEVKAGAVRLETQGISVRQSWRLKNDWSQMSSCDLIWFFITVASNRSKQRGAMKGWQSDEQMRKFWEEKQWMCVKCNELGEWASGCFPILKWFHRRSCWLDLGKTTTQSDNSNHWARTGVPILFKSSNRFTIVCWLKYPEDDNGLMWLKLMKAKIK